MQHRVRPIWVTLASLVLVGACSSGGDGDGDGGGDDFGLTQRDIVAGLTFPTGTPAPADLREVRAFSNLSFSRPIFLTSAGDGTNRLFVAEQDGTIYVFPNRDDVAANERSTFLSINVSRSGNEEGLLGLAFDPDYADNRRFYVYYSLASPRRSRVSRFEASPSDPNVALTNETILLEFNQPFSNHNGGSLAFGPDGYLYVASGDGGSGGDPQNNAQNMDNLLGKILRINTDGTPVADNPFFTTPTANRSFIYAYGLRNPWRISFDRMNGRLWAGDVGQSALEEIDVIVRGGNYGWRLFEGDAVFNNPQSLPASDFEGPIVTYGRSLGQSITGGYVYRGSALPSLRGVYLYGDFASGRLWGLVYDEASGAAASNRQLLQMGTIASFGEDAAGEVYVCSFDGAIYRFEEVGGGGGGEVPDMLSATGLFSDTANLVPTAGLVEYSVNAAFWSDGASKRRWIALPGTTTIDFSATGNWEFPVGTVIVKHFEIELPSGGMRRLETRVLVHAEQGWQGYSYRWNPSGTDAGLLETGATESITVADPVNGTATFDWFFPSRGDCMTCHTEASGRVLGVRTNQLNGDFAYPARMDNQLRAWNHIGLFDRDIGSSSAFAALANPADTTATLAARARAYLETNCAQCHLPAGPTSVNIDFRAAIALGSTNTVDVTPTTGLSAVQDSRRIDPGSPATSVVHELMDRLGAGQMPPLGRNRLDREGLALIEQWIQGGPD